MSMFNNSVFQALTYVGTNANDGQGSALGARQLVDVFGLDATSTVRKVRACFARVRFSAGVAVLGAPVAINYDATMGIYCATATFAASLATSFGGITITANSYSAGNYGWVQVGGPSTVITQATGAVAANARLEHNGAGNTVKTSAVLANCFAYLAGVALGGTGPIPFGQMVLDYGHW